MSDEGVTMLPENVKFTRRNEWCRQEEDRILVFGLTDHAVEKLSDIIYVELPDIGDDVLNDVPCGEVESLYNVVEVFSPADGEVLEVNTRAIDTPEIIPKDPYKDGWLLKIRVNDPSQLQDLLTPQQYADKIKQRG